MNVTYSVNGKPISFKELATLEITRKDYIDFIEELKRKANENIKKG